MSENSVFVISIVPFLDYFTRMRIIEKDFEVNVDGTEDWWFMDEYDSAEAFEAMQKNVMTNVFSGDEAEAIKKRQQDLLALMVQGTTLEPLIYSEITGARIEFEPYKFRAFALARFA